MQTCYLSEFIDIAEFTLHGNEEYVALVVLPIEEIESDHFDEISVKDVEFTGNLLTPCFEFIHETQESQELNNFDLDYQAQIEEMVLEELGYQEESDNEFGMEDYTVGFDLLDVLQRQYQKMAERNNNDNSQKDFLSSSTSVSGEMTLQKSQDFDHIEFQENTGYPFESRRDKVERYLRKRKNRNWNKKISYKCRKEVADSRLRVKGRFVTRVQANKLLGINTSNMSIDLIRTLLESKFGKEKEAQSEELSGKHL